MESRAEDEQVNLVWLNRTDAKHGTAPDAVSKIEVSAEDIIDAVPDGDWGGIASNANSAGAAWNGTPPVWWFFR